MIIKTDYVLTTLNGEPIKGEDGPLTLGVAIANIVLSPHGSKKGFRPLKSYELAKKFYDKPQVEIDNADLIQLKDVVESCEIVSTIITAQILEKLEEAKISVRKEREKILKELDAKEDSGELNEDGVKKLRSEVQKLVDEINKKLDELRSRKEKEISA